MFALVIPTREIELISPKRGLSSLRNWLLCQRKEQTNERKSYFMFLFMEN